MQDWIEPWQALDVGRARVFENELKREVGPGHVLHGVKANGLAKRSDRDDVLFGLADGRVAQVHLTWSIERRPEWPATVISASLEEWSGKRLKADHAAFLKSENEEGDDPQA